MYSIAHISDLHFGTEIPSIARALSEDLLYLKPNLLLVSGDLTQRARRYQFVEVVAFLNQFPIPKLVVPGNHDVPLFNIFGRLINPLSHYHFYLSEWAESDYEDDVVKVLGINSTRRFRIRRGHLSKKQIAYMHTYFTAKPQHKFHIFMSHHPLVSVPRHFPKDRLIRRHDAVNILEECRINLVLGGHSHRIYISNLQKDYPKLKTPIISAQAGTAISRRKFRCPHAYNLIRIHKHNFAVETRSYSTKDGFSRLDQYAFKR